MLSLLALLVVPAHATDVVGAVSGTWTAASSPYRITGNVTVNSGTSLTIEPGVQVRYTGPFTFLVNGDIQAVGTPGSPILFTRDIATDASRGEGLLRVVSTSVQSHISNTTFEHGLITDASTISPAAGGGLYLFNANIVVEDCIIRNNEAPAGAGIYIVNTGSRDTVVRNNEIYGNQSIDGTSSITGGAGLFANGAGGSGDVQIYNNLIHTNSRSGNAANWEGGGGVHLNSSKAVLVHNTIWGNTSEKGPGLHMSSDGTSYVANNVIWGNTGTLFGAQVTMQPARDPGFTVASTITVENNLVGPGPDPIIQVYRTTFELNWPGDNTIIADPLFGDTSSSDFSLQITSPALDAADWASVAAPALDGWGYDRCDVTSIANTGSGSPPYVDLGAYELIPSAGCANEVCNDGVDNDGTGGVDCDDPGCATYPACCDIDADGYDSQGVCGGNDCDDDDDTINPGVSEQCDGVDEDCDGTADNGLATTPYYTDGDGDNFGTGSATALCGPLPPGMATAGGDCNDGVSSIFPGATETCDGVDEDCDGTPDDGLTTTAYYVDSDGDGFGTGAASVQCGPTPAGMATTNTDCDDSRGTVFPGATETCDGRDDDCNGTVDDAVGANLYYVDTDEDGYGNENAAGTIECTDPGVGYSLDATDCDDTDAALNPGAAEICNNLDDNCDGAADEGVTVPEWVRDADGDGYGGGPVTQACDPPDPTGWTTVAGDCVDGNPDVNPGATEVCNEYDDDCDGNANDGCVIWDTGDPVVDTGTPVEDEGCGCTSSPGSPAGAWLALGVILLGRRRQS